MNKNVKQVKQQNPVKEGQQFPLTIKRLGINGEGVGYFKRQVVFVPGALPEEEVVVEATLVKNSFAQAKIKKIRKASPHRTTAPCPVYDICGGCQLQHLTYEQQLVEKRDIVKQAFERFYKAIPTDQLTILPTKGMDDPWAYRNKSQFQTQYNRGKVEAGLYSEQSHKLIDIDRCIVQHPATDFITNTAKSSLTKWNLPIYSEKKKKAGIRTIVVRVGFKTGQAQIVFVSSTPNLPNLEEVVRDVQEQCPSVVSVMLNIQPSKTPIIFGDKTTLLAGQEKIQEELKEFSYELSARAFFQLNPVQTVTLYDEAKKAAKLTGKEKIVDAYCGSGTIGLWLVDGASEIRGMDVIEASIKDARQNAKKYGYGDKATYEVGTAENWLPKWKQAGFSPDVVVVDPPRVGCDDQFLSTLLKVKPKTFVYVSCNPSTLAKNVQQLSRLYEIDYIQPVDMFPQTAQVEAVVRLTLKKSK
ncbi:23S rRNA (uracil(1939)-C(5))-methyltransferase RlmD [Mangrovibacillus cuniculi]|uniref:23S rRNA (Uracil(1939)-C(5))-methyltransferase RlmD n=1 Tax=Mangrovibacillus cuniculi TaxID=2593652 RepID=A0A7S8HEE9_9BACI|nr:23S rRNA (uracil(1939)-C(5))-methyltransferase RlmD [Mangrovibacillus cuniculi]QPC45769.1 23S rRNA (uracil(1939)-C(5))-methyltransferase RlmD [Mangrovibacillus cuniculi]